MPQAFWHLPSQAKTISSPKAFIRETTRFSFGRVVIYPLLKIIGLHLIQTAASAQLIGFCCCPALPLEILARSACPALSVATPSHAYLWSWCDILLAVALLLAVPD